MKSRDYLNKQFKDPAFKKKFNALELRYTIVGCVNGAGKTTFTTMFKDQCLNLGEIVDADELTKNSAGDSFDGCKAVRNKIRNWFGYRVRKPPPD